MCLKIILSIKSKQFVSAHCQTSLAQKNIDFFLRYLTSRSPQLECRNSYLLIFSQFVNGFVTREDIYDLDKMQIEK